MFEHPKRAKPSTRSNPQKKKAASPEDDTACCKCSLASPRRGTQDARSTLLTLYRRRPAGVK